MAHARSHHNFICPAEAILGIKLNDKAMQNQLSQEKVKLIYQMLFEMATGNHTFRIATNEGNPLDEISKMLNTIAEKFQPSILESGYVNPFYSYQSIVQTTFLLDADLKIKGFNDTAVLILEYDENYLCGIKFQEILAKQTNHIWKTLSVNIISDSNYHNTIQLIFRTAQNKLIPSFCTISKLLYADAIIITSITTILQDVVATSPKTFTKTTKASDAELMQKVYEYILNNLENPLPSSKEIAKIFGINEFRLKDSFRHFYNTSIHHFYNEQRLKKAHLLIQKSNEPIKNIAYNCGFSTYINFYKAFKKRFAYSPSDLQRQTDQE